MDSIGRMGTRVQVFVDFWNFTLSAQEFLKERPNLNWERIGPWLVSRAAEKLSVSDATYEGMAVYLSYNSANNKDAGLVSWASNTLDRFPGVRVVMKERMPKNVPKCPACRVEMACPKCTESIKGTIEKGIDTQLVTDMIADAWEDSWDVAVLVSADRDFVPAVEFLAKKGKKVVNAAFPPGGAELAKKCWASFPASEGLHALRRSN